METPNPEYSSMPEIPKEAREKLEAMKSKLDKYTKAMAKDFKDDIIGVALLPPSKIDSEEKLSKVAGERDSFEVKAKRLSDELAQEKQAREMDKKELDSTLRSHIELIDCTNN